MRELVSEMLGFKVVYDDYCQTIHSDVYAIDGGRDRFLIVDDGGNFIWVPTDDCRLVEVNN